MTRVNPFEMASLLAYASKKINESAATALKEAGEIVKDEAQHMIGVLQPNWKPLTDETESHKKAMGYYLNAPLLAIGEMRDSIKYNVVKSEMTVYVGTDNKKMRYHEFGTNRIPPRPVFGTLLQNPRIMNQVTQKLTDEIAIRGLL